MNEFLAFLAQKITSYDMSILRGLYHNWSNDFLDTVMPMITHLGDGGILWIAIAVILLIPKKTRKTGAAMGVAMLLGLIIANGLIKNLVMRPRPFNTIGTAVLKQNLLIDPPTDWSFPSGHTLHSVAAATAIYKDHTVWGCAAFVMAFLIAFSRLYLQVHYPSDVLAGALLGFLLGLLGCTIVRSISEKLPSNRIKKPIESEK